MTGKQGTHYTLAILDSVIALSTATMVCFGLKPHSLASWTLRPIDVIFLIVFVVCWQYFFTVLHIQDRFSRTASRLFVISKGASFMSLLFSAYVYASHRSLLRPSTLLLAFLIFGLYEGCRFALFHAIADSISERNPRRVVILGSGRRANKAWKEIRTRYHASVALLGFVDNRETIDMPPDVAARFLGRIEQLPDILVQQVVDVVLVALPVKSCYELIQNSINVADEAGVTTLYLTDIFTSRRSPRSLESIFQDLQPRTESYLAAVLLKRIIDFFAALIGIVLLAPLLLVIAASIKFTSPGPVIFVQMRHGFRRRLFPMFKFRSMVANAEALLPSLEGQNEADGPVFKLTNDPRVTKIGQFLRSTSLDELPQLFNVLIGQMSLVGPRPMSTRDVSLMTEAMLMRRFSVRPGMTGLWQVSGRSSTGFDQWVLLDGKYIDRWSLSLDFHILARTVGVVLRRSGAV